MQDLRRDIRHFPGHTHTSTEYTYDWKELVDCVAHGIDVGERVSPFSLRSAEIDLLLLLLLRSKGGLYLRHIVGECNQIYFSVLDRIRYEYSVPCS